MYIGLHNSASLLFLSVCGDIYYTFFYSPHAMCLHVNITLDMQSYVGLASFRFCGLTKWVLYIFIRQL